MQSYTILCIIPNVCAFFSLFRKKCIRKFVQEEIKHYLCSRLKDECLWVILIFVGAIAQLVEQRTENPCVPGSIPGGTTHKENTHKENAERLIADRPAFFIFFPLRLAACGTAPSPYHKGQESLKSIASASVNGTARAPYLLLKS